MTLDSIVGPADIIVMNTSSQGSTNGLKLVSIPPKQELADLNQDGVPHPRMFAFNRMEKLMVEIQEADSGVPIRSQRTFLTTIPSVFTAADLIEWLANRLQIDDTCEVLHLASLLCQYGYFFPVADTKFHMVKEDNSLFRFQKPSLWPGQKHNPDNIEYAIYLVKRALKNKQKSTLEDYEQEALSRLKSVHSNKWDHIIQQAEDHIRRTKDHKKVDKIVAESQEKAYWRIQRPPPGITDCIEYCPVPNRRASNTKKRKTAEDYQKQIDYLNRSMARTRVKTSQALDSIQHHYEVYAEYDSFITPTEPSNPWITDDNSLWIMNSAMAEFPTEKRVRRWAISLKELLSDPRGQWEFEIYLRKEYSGENLRFWLAVEDLKNGAKVLVENKVMEIYDEFLGPGAPNEVNVDGRTIEIIHQNMRIPSRYTYNEAQEHVFNLMKKDSYPRFLRSENYRNILDNAAHPSHKKKFSLFGNKKKNSLTPPDKNEPESRRGSSCSDKGKYTIDNDSSQNGISIMEMVKGRMCGHQHSLSTSDLLDIDCQKNKIVQQTSRLSSPSQSKSSLNHNIVSGKRPSRQLDVPQKSPVSSQSIDYTDNASCVSLFVPESRRKSSTCSTSSNVVAPWEDLDN